MIDSTKDSFSKIKEAFEKLRDNKKLESILAARSGYEDNLAEHLSEVSELEFKNISKNKLVSYSGDIQVNSGTETYILEIKKGNLRLELIRLARLYKQIKPDNNRKKHIFVFIWKKSLDIYFVNVESLFEKLNINENSYKELESFNEKYMSSFPKKNGDQKIHAIEFIISIRKMDLDSLKCI